MLYPPGVEITEVGMIFTTNLGMLDMGNEGDLGSVLMLDDLDLVNPCEQFPPYEITIVTEPTCDEMTATLDAGEGWEEIEWSTEETTREIEVSVEETVTITVAVYDLQTGCEFSDIIVLEPPAGCLGIEQSDLKTMQVDVYPNPSGGMVTVELSHAVPGKYLAEVMDITGKIIVSREFVMSDTHKKISLDLRNSTEGLYLLRVTGEEINYSQRLIKK